MKAKLNTQQQKLHDELIEHNLSNNLQANQYVAFGSVEFNTPSKVLLDKETNFYNIGDSFEEDAKACAEVITILLLAKEASSNSGIHRNNACAAHRIYSTLQFHCEGRTLDDIGKDLGMDRRHINRYNKRFIEWSAQYGSDIAKRVSPERLLMLMFTFKRPLYSLQYAFDDLKISLFNLLQKLVDRAAESNTEVFLNPENEADCELTSKFLKALSYKGGK